MKTAILHIGLPKTGTTSIQRMLFEAARSAALPGVGYHLPFPSSMHSQHLLWALFRRDRPLSRWPQFEIDRLSSAAPVQPALEHCWDRIARSENVVISSEYLPAWSKEEVAALAARFRDAGFARVLVVVYVREPAQAYLSMAQQYIRAADRLPLPEDFKVGYEYAIEKFRSIFGEVQVRIFDRHQMLDGCAVRDFISLLEREFCFRVDQKKIFVANVNDTLSAEAMIVLLEWRRTHFAGNNLVSAKGVRLVQVLMSSRQEIRQTKPALKPAVAHMVRRASAGDVDYLRRLGVTFEHESATMEEETEAPNRKQHEIVSCHDATSILTHHDPQALAALRMFVQQRMGDPSMSPITQFPTHGPVFADRLNARVWRLLEAQACELHFIGASVTAQKQSWADALHTLLIGTTGHAHKITKNAMGGVGILFGLGHYCAPTGRPLIAFIEFSTGDFNVGLSPASELGWMIEALIARVRDEGGEVIIVHNWRADNREVQDRCGVFSAYENVSRRCGVATIHNTRWVEHQLQTDPAEEKRLFRDICHTTQAGAQAYAQHVFDALRSAPDSSLISASAEPAKQPADWPQVLTLGAAFMHGEVLQRMYEYPATGQKITFHEILQGARVLVRVSGRLMGVGFISGPTSGWVALYIDGKLVRRFRCFDQHSYYERYILLPLFIDLQARTIELRMMDEPVDFSLARQQHPDFTAPRRVFFAHFIGTRLVADPIAEDL